MSRNAGAGGWTLFADALDEARARGAREQRKARIGRPKRHLSDLELRHVKRLETIGRRLDRHLITKGPDWIPDPDFVKTATELAGALVKLSRSIRLAAEAEKSAMRSLDEGQLLDVLRVSLPRIAAQLGEDEWRALLSIGMAEDIAEAAIAVWKQRQNAQGEP